MLSAVCWQKTKQYVNESKVVCTQIYLINFVDKNLRKVYYLIINMPPKSSPVCIVCKNVESLLWRSADQGQICQECFQLRESKDKDVLENSIVEINEDNKIKTTKEKDNKETAGENKNNAGEEKRLRKSTRATRFKAKVNNANTNGSGEKTGSTGASTKISCKGRNRRSLFKRTPFKTPLAQATTHSVESVFHKVSIYKFFLL